LLCRVKIPSIREKRILASLPSDGGSRPVAGKHNCGVLEGKQFAPDAFEEQVPVSAGKIPAANTPAEKNVPADNNLFIKKMEAQAPRAMSRHVINPYGCTEQFGGPVFVKQEIGCKGIDFQFKAPTAEELPIAHHRRGVGMHCGLAPMALDYGRGVSDVVKVTVREDQEIHSFAREGRICPLRRVEKNSAIRRLVVETIGVEHTAGKGFEPIHEKMVRELMSKFDFRSSVCKVFTSAIE
jgi:hypothetical protein